jgi:hypothetical protein
MGYLGNSIFSYLNTTKFHIENNLIEWNKKFSESLTKSIHSPGTISFQPAKSEQALVPVPKLNNLINHIPMVSEGIFVMKHVLYNSMLLFVKHFCLHGHDLVPLSSSLKHENKSTRVESSCSLTKAYTRCERWET